MNEYVLTPPGPVGQERSIPSGFYLAQNCPNPFNPKTTIRYQIPHTNHVLLNVYDPLGRLVATLVDQVERPGFKVAELDDSSLSSIDTREEKKEMTQTILLLLGVLLLTGLTFWLIGEYWRPVLRSTGTLMRQIGPCQLLNLNAYMHMSTAAGQTSTLTCSSSQFSVA